ncbi:BHLH domain-containing protein [Mycena chlorophos]|uniref:BHLH domain-containing protein n=1 Tax=Mycena chlorophos TaxID=658473 RepID=A0A8H6SNL1_MYCCL|nr:BHLH domain-containing protein [Mycena chlorophos]
MEFDHAPKTAPASYLDAGDAGFSYLDSDYIRYPTPGLDAMDLPPTSPTSGFHELHNGLGLNHTLNEVYYQPSSPSSSGTAPGPFGSPTEAFTALDSIAPPSLVGPSYQLESAAHRRRGSGSLSPPIHSPSAIPRSLANAGHAHVQQAATSASAAAGRRYNPIARPPRRKAAARRSIDDESDDEDDDFAPSAANTSGGPDTRRETIRRQRIESEQRRRDELRDGYARLKETLPPTNQKSSKVSLLDRATNHVRNLEVAKSELEKRLQEAETQVKHLRHINEVLSVRAVQTRGMVPSY